MNATATLEPTAMQRVDAIETALAQMQPCHLEPEHNFIPGFYCRTLKMPQGAMVVSKIHKTQHPYTVTKGHAAVWTEQDGVVQIKAPFSGITQPGTRRVLYIHEDCEWTTFHATDKLDVAEIEADIIQPHQVQAFEIADLMPQLIEKFNKTEDI